ncbi:hypothetical protein GA0115240_172024 [Streptomyces sp. DvalAA-14]|nr:hypothetical protein GA0115240_172024 [Streptomyces sp. DvalAA-14]
MPVCSAVPLEPTAAERHWLKKMAYGHKTPYRAGQRATIVLMAARGRGNARIAAEIHLGCRLPAETGVPLSRWSCRELAAKLRACPQVGGAASHMATGGHGGRGGRCFAYEASHGAGSG